MKLKIQIIEIIITSILVGLIWTIQLVHYPSFAYVGPNEYVSFHSFHVAAITPFVGSLMIFEFVCFLLSMKYGVYKLFNQGLVVLILLMIIWGTTLFVSVPTHNQLLLGKSDLLITRLVTTNWIRTIAWSLKLAIVSYKLCL